MPLLSMTGFGEVRDKSDDYAFAVELRTVNSRHFKLSMRVTEGYGSLESAAEKVIREYVKRGTVQCNLRVRHLGAADDYRINKQLLNLYVDQLQEVAASREIDERIQLENLTTLPGVVEELSENAEDPGEIWPLLEPLLRTALQNLTTMRATEGEALAEDLKQQCTVVESSLDAIDKLAPRVVEHYRKRIYDRVSEVMGQMNVAVEPGDLVREVALFADRSDISEEVVRLRSHLQQFHEALGLSESTGRKLEFICQEMGRETNTIGSKANDADISTHVVEIKTALERIREQIQNVE